MAIVKILTPDPVAPELEHLLLSSGEEGIDTPTLARAIRPKARLKTARVILSDLQIKGWLTIKKTRALKPSWLGKGYREVKRYTLTKIGRQELIAALTRVPNPRIGT